MNLVYKVRHQVDYKIFGAKLIDVTKELLRKYFLKFAVTCV